MQAHSLTGTIVAISVSVNKGIPKTNVSSALLVTDSGIEGDAHAGPGNRQVSILAMESIEKMLHLGAQVAPGAFAENLTIAGADFTNVAVGDRIIIGTAELVVTQLGKECYSRCAIFEAVGDCVMPREGIFARVSRGGAIKPGDPVTIAKIVVDATDSSSDDSR